MVDVSFCAATTRHPLAACGATTRTVQASRPFSPSPPHFPPHHISMDLSHIVRKASSALTFILLRSAMRCSNSNAIVSDIYPACGCVTWCKSSLGCTLESPCYLLLLSESHFYFQYTIGGMWPAGHTDSSYSIILEIEVGVHEVLYNTEFEFTARVRQFMRRAEKNAAARVIFFAVFRTHSHA